jgi:hypothetical protein
LGIKYPRVIVKSLLGLYAVLMDTIERELLHRIITDRPFAEYITQRIDIGDFDDEVANRIHDGIVDLLCQGKPVSHEVMLEYFESDREASKALENIARYYKLSRDLQASK